MSTAGARWWLVDFRLGKAFLNPPRAGVEIGFPRAAGADPRPAPLAPGVMVVAVEGQARAILHFSTEHLMVDDDTCAENVPPPAAAESALARDS